VAFDAARPMVRVLHDVSLRGMQVAADLALLRAPTQVKLPDRYLFWDLYGDVAALHGKWKMVGQISNHHGKFDKAVREAEGAKFALYNLDEDLGETIDVSEKFPEVYRDLKSRHLDWLRQFAQ